MGLGHKDLFPQEKTIPKCHLGVKEKETENIVGSDWIVAVRC